MRNDVLLRRNKIVYRPFQSILNVSSFLLLVSIILMASCARFNVKPDYVLDTSSGKGLLVASVSYTGAYNFFWQYRGINNPNKGDVTAWTLQNPLDWHDPPGRLAFIEIPAGEYEFYKWILFLTGTKKIYSQPFSVKFQILPGKATYLGNLHLDLREMKYYSLSLRDESNRDLSLFYSKLPNVHTGHVVKSIGKILQ